MTRAAGRGSTQMARAARGTRAPPPKPILKPPKYIDDSIAARVRERRFQSQTMVNESIAESYRVTGLARRACSLSA